MSPKSTKQRPPSAPEPEESRDPEVEEHEPGNRAAETATETLAEGGPEEAADVQLTIKGTDRAARAAAKRFGEGAAAKLPPAAPPKAVEPPDDTDALLADPRNMVLVQRQLPKSVVDPTTGKKIRTGVKMPDRYPCPVTREEIENDIFDNYGGYKYKCSIHPNTANGEGTLLGAFTIYHPDGADVAPYVEGLEEAMREADPRTSVHAGGTDPTMQETDNLAEVKARLQRRLDRAETMKEIKQMEKLTKEAERELESDGRPPAPVAPPGESDEVKRLRAEIAEKDRLLAEKKVNDRFDKLEDSITKLAASVTALATSKPAGDGEASVVKLMMQNQKDMLTQSQQHSKDMLALVQSQAAPKHASDGDNLDKFLDRAQKLQVITGNVPSKSSGRSDVESRLIDIAWDKLTGGGGGDDGEESDPYEDVLKTAIKEFGPIAKTFVEKKMNQETAANGGAPIPPEVMNKIYSEAGIAAAKKVQEDLLSQGIRLIADEHGKLHALPAPKSGAKTPVTPRQPASRVVSETRTSEGVVKKVALEPHNMSQKKPAPSALPAGSAPATDEKGGDVPKCGVFPMLGPNGTEIKIPFPVRPGELQYDRKYAVNFVLDGIRSEILQDIPAKADKDQTVQSYVVDDAVQYLDDELLDRLDEVDSGEKLEQLLGPWGDAAKISEIKKAGESEVVASYLRKLVRTIQREWQRDKAAQK